MSDCLVTSAHPFPTSYPCQPTLQGERTVEACTAKNFENTYLQNLVIQWRPSFDSAAMMERATDPTNRIPAFPDTPTPRPLESLMSQADIDGLEGAKLDKLLEEQLQNATSWRRNESSPVFHYRRR